MDLSKVFFFFFVLRSIRDTNTKNKAEDLNALINKLAPEIKTWTPKPGAVLDLGLALKDPTSRLAINQSCLFVFKLGRSSDCLICNLHRLRKVHLGSRIIKNELSGDSSGVL